MQLLLLCALLLHPPSFKLDTPPVAKALGTYRIPYSLTATKHLMVRAKVNGNGPYNFIVDTGAPALYLATGVADKIGIKGGKDRWGVVDRLEIEGGAVLEKVRARLEDPHQLTGMNQMGLLGVRLDGILGYDVLARFRMEIDLTQTSMHWTKLDYEPPAPLSLAQIMGKKPLKGIQNVASMEQMSKMASSLFARKTPPPVTRGFVGVELASSGEGARVQSVLPSSPAALAGLASGDKITKIKLLGVEERDVKSATELRQMAAEIAAGDTVVFTILRGMEAKRITVQTGKGGL